MVEIMQSRQELLYNRRQKKKQWEMNSMNSYEPGDLPEIWECMGYTKKEWDDMNNPANV
jgi:hypothetical protein